jgi:prolyl oligopeptidase
MLEKKGDIMLRLRPASFLVLLMQVLIADDVFATEPNMTYPTTRKVDVIDTYHGTAVPDPYRWLEDDTSAETAAWVETQNKVTAAHLAKIPFRNKLHDRLEQLFNYPRFSAPVRRGQSWYFSKNDGLQNQAVIYRKTGLDGAPEVLLDPNSLSPDGTTRLGVFQLSRDGTRAVYGLSEGGSDWHTYKVLDVNSRTPLVDTVAWVKVSGAAWAGNGFFYSRYPAPTGGKDLSAKNVDHQVYFHRIGTPQSADELVFSDPVHPERFHTVETTEDERYLVLTVSDRGTGKQGNALFYRDLTSTDKTFRPIVGDIGDDSFSLIDNVGDKFLVSTNHKAPNGRVVLFDPQSPTESAWKDVLPERAQPLDGVATGGGKLFASYLHDVATRAYVFDLTGKQEHEITLPGPGSVQSLGGRRDDRQVFFTYTSFNYPPTIFSYDIATKTTTPFREVTIPGFKSDEYIVTQVFVTSKDGTKVPMFLTHKKGLQKNGHNPTLMYGYGGFNVTLSPSFSALRVALLEQGFIYASVNLRGGGEYGEAWHEAGTGQHKQNVFDDFIAAGEWLIANHYTSSASLALHGGSNGGLLVGAVMNQRPDLAAVAIPEVGVMDMLRFHKFTIGWNWIPDYGSSDNAGEFKTLFAYSPLHNLKAGTDYPATLITTADHDDRVVPAHSFKYAATLQERQGGPAPVLIRIDTKSGHGSSNTRKQIENTADIYAFVMFHLGVTPAW